jgi:hypothetical protein
VKPGAVGSTFPPPIAAPQASTCGATRSARRPRRPMTPSTRTRLSAARAATPHQGNQQQFTGRFSWSHPSAPGRSQSVNRRLSTDQEQFSCSPGRAFWARLVLAQELAARRRIASSPVSSSLMRRRAARGSADSLEEVPGRRPRSMSSGVATSTTSRDGCRARWRSAWPACRHERGRSPEHGTPAGRDAAWLSAFRAGRQLATRDPEPFWWGRSSCHVSMKQTR